MPTRTARSSARNGVADRAKLGDRLDDAEAGAHRALGVVLMRLRVAEINQHAVAEIFGDVAAVGAITPAQAS